MGGRLVAVQDLNDRRHAAALHALLNIFDAIIEDDDIRPPLACSLHCKVQKQQKAKSKKEKRRKRESGEEREDGK